MKDIKKDKKERPLQGALFCFIKGHIKFANPSNVFTFPIYCISGGSVAFNISHNAGRSFLTTAQTTSSSTFI